MQLCPLNVTLVINVKTGLHSVLLQGFPLTVTPVRVPSCLVRQRVSHEANLTVLGIKCVPVGAEELEYPGPVEDLLSDLAVLEAAALHPVLVERQHAVGEAHCKEI